jgi:translation initiation factor IF-2
MAKIRVYELATKLGLDNKEIVDKLNQAGIEVKNHMSALEEEVALKFESSQSQQADAAPVDETVEVKVKEERLGSGLIRRRRKTVAKEEPVAEEPVVAAEESAPVVAAEPVVEESAPAAEEVAAQKADAPVEKAGDVEEPAAVVEAAAEVSDETPDATEAVAAEAEAKPEKAAAAKKKTKKESNSTAKILGRVELPKPAERPRRQPAGADKGKKPAPGSRPDRPARPARPAAPRAAGAPGAPMVPDVPSEKEGRSKKKKKGGREAAGGPIATSATVRAVKLTDLPKRLKSRSRKRSSVKSGLPML